MKYLAYLVAALVMELAAIFLAPLLPLSALDKAHLPRWLAWFDTPDNDLDGDAGWLILHWQWRYRLPQWACSYVGRFGWLLRNRAYGFKWSVLAVEVNHTPMFSGDPTINRNNGRFGFLRCWHGYSWQWKWVQPIGRTGYCWMINLGWLLDAYVSNPRLLETQPRALFLFSPRVCKIHWPSKL